MSSISGRCCRCSHEPLIPYLAKISDLYPLAILKVDKLKDGPMAVDGEVGGNLLRGEWVVSVFGSVVDDLVGIRLFSFLFPREDSAIEI